MPPPPRGGGWVGLALASGTCAAVNGAFAKLTTTELTASLAAWVARALGAESVGGTVELAVRGVSVAPLRSIYHFTLSVARRGFFFFY
jgi:hypothetical protein